MNPQRQGVAESPCNRQLPGVKPAPHERERAKLGSAEAFRAWGY